MGAKPRHRVSFAYRLARLLLGSSERQAFLDRAAIPWLFRLVPRRFHHALGVRLLSLSPHYFIYQHNTEVYPTWMTREQILDAEYRRNAESRRKLGEGIIRPYVRKDMTVLDFGCGPGFVAKAVSPYAGRVIGTDISRGVIAIARAINGAANVEYVHHAGTQLHRIADASIDLVYVFAVFQHLTLAETRSVFREFRRVLKPGGQGVCHVVFSPNENARALEESVSNKEEGKLVRKGILGKVRRRIQQRLALRMVYAQPAEMRQLLEETGFRDIHFARVGELAEINDDIGKEHLMIFRK